MLFVSIGKDEHEPTLRPHLISAVEWLGGEAKPE